MTIVPLESQHIPRLASIWHDVLGSVWFPETPRGTLIQRCEERLARHVNTGSIPLAYVALNEEAVPIGMCCLRETDGIRPELTPWLGGLVVEKKHQRQGIGRLLIHAVTEKAKALGYETLYLLTLDPTMPEYYGRLGWEKIGMDTFEGLPATVMSKSL